MSAPAPNALPPYPRGESHGAALRLENRRTRHAQATQELLAELAAVEDAFTDALAADDQRTATQARLAEMAARRRQRRI